MTLRGAEFDSVFAEQQSELEVVHLHETRTKIEEVPINGLTLDSLIHNGMVSTDIYVKVGVTQTGDECVYVNLKNWPEAIARSFIAFLNENPRIAVEDVRKKLQSIAKDLPAGVKTWSFIFAPERVIPTLIL
ncbi:MAG TPA: hypothetical protein PKX78_04005 [Candidatus Woesebacteria bacterium]|nr:hypothetical protein [Candidatus Woesebacteria bacterium]